MEGKYSFPASDTRACSAHPNAHATLEPETKTPVNSKFSVLRLIALYATALFVLESTSVLAADRGTLVREAIIYLAPDASSNKLGEVQRFAFDVRAGIEQDKFIFLPRNDRGDAAAIHAGNAPNLERGRRENAAGVAEGNDRVRLAIPDEFGGEGDGGILFFAERAGRLVVHLDDFAGVDHAHPMVAEAALGQGGMDVCLVADKVKSGDFLAGLQRQLGPRDHDAAPVVAAHDIHCDSHRRIKKRGKKFPRRHAEGSACVDRQHLAPLVITARRADPVRHMRLGALRTFADLRQFQHAVVSAAHFHPAR